MHADGNYLVLGDGRRIGPFSSHWAACAAMVRRHNPDFQSLGGDKERDLILERDSSDTPTKEKSYAAS